MICFSEILAEGIDSRLDFTLPLGNSAAIMTSRQSENDAFIRLILGFLAPDEGSFCIGADQPAFLKDSEIALLRRKTGAIYQDGGLISNLNLWENLTLQLAFEAVVPNKEIEQLAMAALSKAGYSGSYTASVSRLTLFQRRQVAFARAFLVKPDLMVYQSTFEGVSRAEQTQLSTLAWDYHRGGEITSIFLTSYPESLRGMDFDFTYYAGGMSQP
ncbi:MAG: hypothetical protein HXX17_13610 [Geobacteraceae bacterium]|nr:hypothetical protein [Geobacteraceae bacterium]